jgi:hypothetical protein
MFQCYDSLVSSLKINNPLLILSDNNRSDLIRHFKKRPGRDSNPGQGSDSPPYWTGLYDAHLHLYTTRAIAKLKVKSKL